MNKTYKSGMMALSAVVFLTSCSENESLQQAHLSTDQINFIASMAHQWDANTKSAPQNPSSRSAGVRDNEAPIHVNANLAKPLYLHPVVQDGIHIWSKQGTPITRSGAPIEDVEQERVVQTRGSKKDNLNAYSNFGVTALYQNEDAYVSLFDNATATNSTGKYWNIPNASNNNTWPIDSKVSFHAYAPHSSESKLNSMLKSSPDLTNVQTNIHYEAKVSSVDIENQPDLIVATNAAQRSKTAANTPVALQFSHALTAVSFAMSSDLADVIGSGAQLKSVSLQNIPNEGDCQLIAQDDKHSSPSTIWKLDYDNDKNKKGTYTFDLSTKNITVGSDLALTDDNQTLMMIPQTLPDGAKLEFTFKLNNQPQPQVLTVNLEGQKWEAGKSVIYKLSAKAINTLDATDVTYPSTWTASSFPKESFTTNDAIGLYVVDKNNQIVESNVKLTLGSNSKWTTDKKFLKLAGYKYFAYYPYKSDDQNVNTSASDASTFFADKISKWNPAQDQSSALLSQDLQVATGVVGQDASTLKFSMEHSMGLAVLNLESKSIAKTRRFKNNSYTYYYPNLTGRVTTMPTKDTDYTDDTATEPVSASTAFSGYIPYKTSTANRYLQIVKPSTDISFKASDELGKPRSAWGTLTPYTFNVAKNKAVSKNIKTDADFYYLARVYTCTQSVEEFTAPYTGTYKLQCWGAQGGSVQLSHETGKPFAGGGKGGYSYGDANLTEGKVLYVYVGGTPAPQTKMTSDCYLEGGYNGGGHAFWWQDDNINNGAGGGATHIASVTGLLSKLSQNKNDIYMVAGAGGGSATDGTTSGTQNGGYGGGSKGGDGVMSGNHHGYRGLGGTDTAPGNSIASPSPLTDYNPGPNNPAAFGKGGYGYHGAGGAGGGAGLYGGGGATVWCSAGGGSGYVNSLLTNAKTIAGDTDFPSPNGDTETGHSGDGACIISWFLK
ncbi:fimbrillin family protein [Segatella copri]|uniref:glycine-rich protein n=1 Tax=Segatella copri TaxID=165179 RepID=UPI0029162F30|nr:glycine-rich protein [Segatella copri]MDV3120836.1 fimbrillin family protein [Segatella copri]